MQELLFGSWSPQIIAYGEHYPWRVFAAVLVAALLLDLMFRTRSSSSDGADISSFDFGVGVGDGDGDGGGCGD
jgi:hypothetical protein